VRLAPDPTGDANPLHEALTGSLDFSAEPWTAFSAAVAAGVAQRHAAPPRIISNAMVDPGPSPR